MNFFKSDSSLTLWRQNLKRNWVASLIRLIIFLFPVFFLQPDCSRYLIAKFPVVIVIIAALFLINEFFDFKQAKEKKMWEDNIANLQKENITLRTDYSFASSALNELPSNFLTNISTFLSLTKTERVSLYIFKQSNFKIIGRFSEHPIYCQINRKEYPSDRGYISKCLQNNNGKDYFIIQGLPNNNSNNYLNRVSKETGMTKEEILSLPMKSRTYFIKIIKNSYNKNDIGVLVIESVSPNLDMKVSDLNIKLNDLIIPYISIFLETDSKLEKEKCHEE